jgi:hypothetical protein
MEDSSDATEGTDRAAKSETSAGSSVGFGVLLGASVGAWVVGAGVGGVGAGVRGANAARALSSHTIGLSIHVALACVDCVGVGAVGAVVNAPSAFSSHTTCCVSHDDILGARVLTHRQKKNSNI